MAVALVVPPDLEQVRALARALSAADNGGSEATWEQWMPLAHAIHDNFPADHVIVPELDARALMRYRESTKVGRTELMDNLLRASRRLLRDFLDPRDRAIALGNLASIIVEIDRFDFKAGNDKE